MVLEPEKIARLLGKEKVCDKRVLDAILSGIKHGDLIPEVLISEILGSDDFRILSDGHHRALAYFSANVGMPYLVGEPSHESPSSLTRIQDIQIGLYNFTYGLRRNNSDFYRW